MAPFPHGSIMRAYNLIPDRNPKQITQSIESFYPTTD